MPDKELDVFFVLDTSGSMYGFNKEKITALNHAMEECTIMLKNLSKRNDEINLKIAVLEFNSCCHWLTENGLEEIDQFMFEPLEARDATDIGEAISELNSKLSRHAFFDSPSGYYCPVFIFVTDGFATDDYKKAVEMINKNKWFKRGTKIGFALGNNYDIEMLTQIVGNHEVVFENEDLDLLGTSMKEILEKTIHKVEFGRKTRNIPEDVPLQGSDPGGVPLQDLDGWDDLWQ